MSKFDKQLRPAQDLVVEIEQQLDAYMAIAAKRDKELCETQLTFVRN